MVNLVSIPDRQKQKQLGHISMVKQYCIRDNNSVSKSAASITLLLTTDGNSSCNDAEDGTDIWMTIELV